MRPDGPKAIQFTGAASDVPKTGIRLSIRCSGAIRIPHSHPFRGKTMPILRSLLIVISILFVLILLVLAGCGPRVLKTIDEPFRPVAGGWSSNPPGSSQSEEY